MPISSGASPTARNKQTFGFENVIDDLLVAVHSPVVSSCSLTPRQLVDCTSRLARAAEHRWHNLLYRNIQTKIQRCLSADTVEMRRRLTDINAARRNHSKGVIGKENLDIKSRLSLTSPRIDDRSPAMVYLKKRTEERLQNFHLQLSQTSKESKQYFHRLRGVSPKITPRLDADVEAIRRRLATRKQIADAFEQLKRTREINLLLSRHALRPVTIPSYVAATAINSPFKLPPPSASPMPKLSLPPRSL